jgi:hypothetical protein
MSHCRMSAYPGSVHRKLVVAVDIGTAYTVVSYCLLGPGDVPQIHEVSCAQQVRGAQILMIPKDPELAQADPGGYFRPGAYCC